MNFKIKSSVVVKKGNKWFIGKFDDKKFVSIKQVKKLSDVKDVSEYITLKKWLRNRNKPVSLEKKILKNTGLSSIYILNKPINPSVEEFEDYWWEDINKLCKNCKKNCKQSYIVEVCKCPLFEGVI